VEKLDISNGILRVSNNTNPSNENDNAAYFGKIDGNAILSHSIAVAFRVNANERARIDSNGRFLIGTSSGRTNIKFSSTALAPDSQIEGSAGSIALGITRNSNSPNASSIYLSKTRGTTNGSNTIVQQGDRLGSLSFNGADGANLLQAARIDGEIDGTPGTDAMPGRLTFFTNAGTVTPSERMRISNDGNIYIGKTTDSTSETGFTLTQSGFARIIRDNQICLILQRLNSDGNVQIFRRDNVNVGSISVTTSSTAYNTSSDYRLKENVVPLANAADRVNQLQVHRFNFIADPDTTVDGFLAHEAQAVVPECVTGTKDEVDDEGNPVYQGIDQSKIVPLLTAALQEALAKIETLEQRLTDAGL